MSRIKTRASLTELRQWPLSSSVKEQQGAHRADEVTRRPLRWQLLSRALTMAVYTFGLECGYMLALPSWLRAVSAYSAAAIVPMMLPTAHGITAAWQPRLPQPVSLELVFSLASASVVCAIMWLCPVWILWWTKDGVDDNVTPHIEESSQVDGRP